MPPPTFSLLMTNYNMEKYLKHAVKSVLTQTYGNWELIFVDDASTDTSIKILKPYLKKDSRIKLVKHNKNLGYGMALQTAIAYSTGRIIGIIDSDDALAPNALDVMNDVYKGNPDVGMVYSQYQICNKHMKFTKMGNCGPVYKGMTWLQSILHAPKKKRKRISHFKTFLRSAYDKTKGFHKYRRTVDKDIVLKLELVTKLLFVDKVLYYYRKHSGGISCKFPSFQKKVLKLAVKRAKAAGTL